MKNVQWKKISHVAFLYFCMEFWFSSIFALEQLDNLIPPKIALYFSVGAYHVNSIEKIFVPELLCSWKQWKL